LSEHSREQPGEHPMHRGTPKTLDRFARQVFPILLPVKQTPVALSFADCCQTGGRRSGPCANQPSPSDGNAGADQECAAASRSCQPNLCQGRRRNRKCALPRTSVPSVKGKQESILECKAQIFGAWTACRRRKVCRENRL